MVDLRSLASNLGSLLEDAILATNLELSVLLPRGLSVRTTSEDPTAETPASASGVTRFVRQFGSVTRKTSATLTFDLSEEILRIGQEQGALPLQVQLRYTRGTGEQVLQVFSASPTVTQIRDAAETALNGAAVGLCCIHTSARLAQQGKYREARLELISTCRLLQRAMKTPDQEDAYLAFVVQAEKLDGFMRERELQERVLGLAGGSNRGRDDDASRSMYQMKNLSFRDFVAHC